MKSAYLSFAGPAYRVIEHERAQLTSFARSRSLPAWLSARARIIFDTLHHMQ